jgi:beta-lactamase superfamily II metal-dependent hydrolase
MVVTGLEIDMLSLGDADCSIISAWTPAGPQYVVIDGGKASDAAAVREFLRSRGITTIWAVVCTHMHGDHVGGLIKLVEDKSLTIHNGWMHDIRKHLLPSSLLRATRGYSKEADAVREVVDNTRELAAAFSKRSINLSEPFAGSVVAGYPELVVLGPSRAFYAAALQEFSSIVEPRHVPPPPFLGLGALSNYSFDTLYRPIEPATPTLVPGLLSAQPHPAAFGSLHDLLGDATIKINPKTQPYNETSVILGCTLNEHRYLFTADAGANALRRVPVDWKDVTWMQVPHHGSDGNLSRDLTERFRPTYAYISACGDEDHPSRSVVSALVKVGSKVFSTQSGNLRHLHGNVPHRPEYKPAEELRGTGSPIPVLKVPPFMPGLR